MYFSTLDEFREAVKALIFDLGRCGLEVHGDRVNRIVFEGGASFGTSDLRELAQLLRSIRPELEPPLRETVSHLEGFARNFRRSN